jgi:hypothetical protein
MQCSASCRLQGVRDRPAAADYVRVLAALSRSLGARPLFEDGSATTILSHALSGLVNALAADDDTWTGPRRDPALLPNCSGALVPAGQLWLADTDLARHASVRAALEEAKMQQLHPAALEELDRLFKPPPPAAAGLRASSVTLTGVLHQKVGLNLISAVLQQSGAAVAVADAEPIAEDDPRWEGFEALERIVSSRAFRVCLRAAVERCDREAAQQVGFRRHVALLRHFSIELVRSDNMSQVVTLRPPGGAAPVQVRLASPPVLKDNVLHVGLDDGQRVCAAADSGA